MPKYWLESYGCSANLSDSEIMKGLLESAGFRQAKSPEEADINIINTCIVKTPTEQKMIHRIKKLSSLKKPLIVAGCMAKTEKDIIERINPNASLISPYTIKKIVEVARKCLKNERCIEIENGFEQKAFVPKIRTNPIIDIVQIAQGCLSFCTFCQTKLARGNLKSYRPELIRNEILTALKDGCKEIWLTSQDNSCYGLDIKTNLAELLESITKIDGKFFVRVGMMNPLHFKFKLKIEDLVKSFKNYKIFKFLHLCVQSGSDKILKDMKRGYEVKDFEKIVKEFRREMKISLATDIIVGYPTETEEDFEQTIKLIEKIKPDITNISRFGARPGTYASKLKQLDQRILKKRSTFLTKFCEEISLKRNEKWIGWEGEALVDEIGKNCFIARNFAYKPIVIQKKENLFGKFVEVKIEEARPNFLFGRIKSF